MKIGTYFAYWEQEWDVDFFPYISKVKNLGFDVLEIAAGGLAAPLLLEILMFIMVVGISEVLCIFFDCEGVGKIFSVFKTSGVLILSSYIFELLVLVMGVALTLMIKS